MQKLNVEIIAEAKKAKMKQLESELRQVIITEGTRTNFICPFCKYQSDKNPKGSARVFDENTFKCFACGTWRQV